MSLDAKDNSKMTRTEIIAVQTRLKELGFDPGKIDGILGPRTNSAIIAFKRSLGLKPRAWVGKKTWESLSQNNPVADLPWIEEARKALNRHEVYDNKWLKKWLASDGYALGDPSKLPWCGDFIETAIRLGLPDEPVPKNPYGALNWLEFGVPCLPTYGCVAAIYRKGGGHVMFIVGQDASRYYAMGGNQSNKSSIVPVDKSRFTPDSFRWPSTYPNRSNGSVPWMTSSDVSNTQEG